MNQTTDATSVPGCLVEVLVTTAENMSFSFMIGPCTLPLSWITEVFWILHAPDS